MGTSTSVIDDEESCRLVQGSIGMLTEYIPEHGPEQHMPSRPPPVRRIQRKTRVCGS